jgi:Spy/CpxP family protein refolding chaperone
MKKISTRRNFLLLALTLTMPMITGGSVLAVTVTRQQTPQTEQATRAQEPSSQPNNANQDPITQLNLNPEQRQQIRAIREQTKDERAAINRRLRETQMALDQALNAANPNEALIDQRAREAGEAQAAAVRMRALMQNRIRRVLTPEQANTLRQLQAQAKDARREQRQVNGANQGKGPAVNRRNQGNGIVNRPALRRNGLSRKPRS